MTYKFTPANTIDHLNVCFERGSGRVSAKIKSQWAIAGSDEWIDEELELELGAHLDTAHDNAEVDALSGIEPDWGLLNTDKDYRRRYVGVLLNAYRSNCLS